MRKIDRQHVETLPVYDFEVEEDHSFLAGGLVVHNCVGSGFGTLLMILAAIEVVRLKDPELALIPWWPLAYGRGRMYGGMNGRGEGSFSEAQIEGAQKDGNLPSNLEGLPTFSDSNGLTLTEGIELTWSDGARISETWLKQSRPHIIKSAAVVRNAADAKAAILNGYPIMFCGNWGGLMKCPIVGTPPCLLNRASGSWAHNETCMAYWAHPELGDLFGIWNQWGLTVHGSDPAGLPAGAYWIKAADFDRQARGGSCIAVSQFNGFPRNDWVSWSDLW